MNAEEPIQAIGENADPPSKDFPESATPQTLSVPRPLTLIRLINQWQPMGIRVVVNVPFKADDQTFFFLIRNGPFIPRWDKLARNENGADVSMYAYNNMRNVFTVPQTSGPLNRLFFVNYPDNYGITVQHYDYPPIISTVAQAFRKWRGDMQYRMRLIAGFVTQAYLFVAPLKNSFMPVGVYNEYKTTPVPTRLDLSYRELMTNAYVMTDASMFRHSEVTVPYEYPVPWYDQYDWMNKRINPQSTAGAALDANFETFGDNFIIVGCRGNIDSTEAKTMTFELEYRCSEGFQFADPGFPPVDMHLPIARMKNLDYDTWKPLKQMPNAAWASDGVSKIVATSTLSGKPFPLANPATLSNSSSTPQKKVTKIVPDEVKAEVLPPKEIESQPAPKTLEGMETLQIHPKTSDMKQMYVECTVAGPDARRRTYCRTEDGRKWDSFEGEQMNRVGTPVDPKARHVRSHLHHVREHDFT